MSDEYIDLDEIEELPDDFFNQVNDSSSSSESDKNEITTLKKEKPKPKEKLSATDDLVVDNLVEAFALLSTMLEEAKHTKENIEKIHEAILKLLEAIESLKDVSEEFSKIDQIVKEMNSLVRAISANNANIKELIDIIYKIVDKQKKLERDVNSIKNEIFFTDVEGGEGRKDKVSILEMIHLGATFGIFVLLIILIKKVGF